MCHVIRPNTTFNQGIEGKGCYFRLSALGPGLLAGLKTLDLGSDGKIRPEYQKDAPFSYLKLKDPSPETYGSFELGRHQIFAFYPLDYSEIKSLSYDQRNILLNELSEQEVQFNIPTQFLVIRRSIRRFRAGLHLHPFFMQGKISMIQNRRKYGANTYLEPRFKSSFNSMSLAVIPVIAIFRISDILFYDGIELSVKRFYVINSKQWYKKNMTDREDLSPLFKRDKRREADLIFQINRFVNFTCILIDFLRKRKDVKQISAQLEKMK